MGLGDTPKPPAGGFLLLFFSSLTWFLIAVSSLLTSNAEFVK